MTTEDLCRFTTDGYLILPGVVPWDLLAAADAEIDGLVSQEPPPAGTASHHFYFLPPAHLPAAGSHLAHQRLFGEQGVGALLPVSGHPLSLDRPPRLAEPHPLLARRGDLLLAHFLLGHNIGGNLSSHTRRILYYRLSCAGHESRWAETFLDAFTEYGPVRNAGH